jgi:elongation factor G
LLPNPAEGNLPAFVKGEGDAAVPFQALPDASLHVIAHVFKIEIDPYVGKTAYARVYQGTMRQGMQLFAGDSRKSFKVAHLFHVQGKQLTEVDQAMPGDIVALTKVDELSFDAVLHDAGEDDHVHMKSLDIPHAVLGLAIKPKKQSDTSKLAEVLHKLTAEDAGLHVEHDANTHEAVIRGLGEMHLESVLERIREQFHLDIESHPPTIPYRETLSKPAEGHHRHKKQSGGAGQFGEVFLRVEPLERGAGFEFVDAVKGGVIPGVFIPAVEKGVREAMATGMVAGFPMQDVRVTVYDGKTHAVDGKEIAFVSAGKKAMREAAMQAAPVILEPIVNIEVTAPEHCFGDISGDLSWRRGQITGSDSGRGGMMSIKAIVPLAELDNYQPRLKSMTGGQGVYTLELSHYEQVPSEVQRKLSAGFKLQQEED